ncbi:unnamed protein product [Owenia fusiformis]|uniref:Uncharacterized protein n=1 Tax=Owenia fusiformis TaxID=6347 RepID=A0A8J1TM93_OWEFU|nr:unnamed protein product [Owenia fusiformis]
MKVFTALLLLVLLDVCMCAGETSSRSKGKGSRHSGSSSEEEKCIPRNRRESTQGNFTSQVTFSGIVDSKGSPYNFTLEQGLLEPWKMVDPDVKTEADVIAEGREFVAYVKQRFNVDISTLTDDELLMGSQRTFGKLSFFGYLIDADVRLISKTTPSQQVNYYSNTKYKGLGYALFAVDDVFLTGGEYTGLMPNQSVIYAEIARIDSNECDFDEQLHIIKTRPLGSHPAKMVNGVYVGANTWEAEVWSSIYGHGVQYSVDMHGVYVYAFVNIFSNP